MQSMETGPGLARAMAAVVANRVDVINMSYGEATSTPDAGRIVELANVRHHRSRARSANIAVHHMFMTCS